MLWLELIGMVFHFEVIFVLNLQQMIRVLLQALPTFILGMSPLALQRQQEL